MGYSAPLAVDDIVTRLLSKHSAEISEKLPFSFTPLHYNTKTEYGVYYSILVHIPPKRSRFRILIFQKMPMVNNITVLESVIAVEEG